MTEAARSGSVTGGAEKIVEARVPAMTSMTKVFFRKYRLYLYTALNRLMRSGQLGACVPFAFERCVLRKENCCFPSVSFWRTGRTTLLADVDVRLRLPVSGGEREWNGYMALALDAERDFAGSLEEWGSAEERTEREELFARLSPFLLPIYKAGELDEEGERLWRCYLPEALTDPGRRNPRELAERMGLKVMPVYLPRENRARGIVFFRDGELTVLDRPEKEGGKPFRTRVEKGTVIVNLNRVKGERCGVDILHECMHWEEHYMAFRLQELDTGDLKRLQAETVRLPRSRRRLQPDRMTEWQANRGAMALLLPRTDFLRRMEEKRERLAGQKMKNRGALYQRIGKELAVELEVPEYIVRMRMIQLGHIAARGAMNVVDRVEIPPFAFREEALPTPEQTFVIKRQDLEELTESSSALRSLVDGRTFLYADGHLVINHPKYVSRRGLFPHLTDWANAHIDECCLRFNREYEEREDSEPPEDGQMYFDREYAARSEFYMDDEINRRELRFVQAQREYRETFPKGLREAFNVLNRRCGLSQEKTAELMHMEPRTLRRRLAGDGKGITLDMAVALCLIWQTPDWISELFLNAAHLYLREDDGRDRALALILRMMWTDGVEEADRFLRKEGYEGLGW
ncbi:MAG: hypothetical protein IKH18_08775 [Clostridia bacterium]|nr:hypothetical protein [Clostridia bacterium]